MSGFIRAASVSDIPSGEGRTIDLGGRQIALFHVAGSFHAIVQNRLRLRRETDKLSTPPTPPERPISPEAPC